MTTHLYSASPAPSPRGHFEAPAVFARQGLLSPGVRLFRVIGFPAKAAWVSAAFVLPLLLLSAALWHTATRQIDFSARERLGIEHVRPVLTLLDAAQKRRRAATARAPDLPEMQEKLGAAFQAVERENARLGALFHSDEAFGKLQRAEQAIDRNADAMKTFAAHTAYVEAVIELLSDIADGSNLTLDPELESFYLMDSVIFQQPRLIESLGQLRGMGNAILRTHKLSTPQRDRLASQRTSAGTLQAALAKSLGRAAATVPGLSKQVDTTEAMVLSGAFLQAVDVQLLGEAPTGEADAFLADANKAIGAHYAASARLLTALDGVLEQRVATLRRTLWLQMGLAAAGVALAFYLLVAFYRVTRGGIAEISRHLTDISRGDLTASPRPWGRDEIAALMTTLAATLQSLRRVVHHVRQGAGEIEVASAEVATASMDLSNRTEETAARLQRANSAMDQITGTVRQTADAAAGAAEIVTDNARVAAEGGSIVGNAVQTMDGIRSSSNRIAEIIAVIDGIAFQTNILALNAAVEAARAGEQGRGFAVVASEVRSLSQRTAGAAREVRSLIQSSVEQVASGAQVVGEAGTTMRDIVSNADRIKALIGDISRSVVNQTSELGEVGNTVQHLEGLTQQNAALVEQTAAAAATLRDNTARLSREVAFFTLPAGAAGDLER